MIFKVKPEIVALKDKLFKSTSYDIRAYVGEIGHFFSDKAVLTPETMKVAGILMGSVIFKRADGTTINLNPGDAVVIGYDNGPTSKTLADAFGEGLRSQGVNVYDIGMASSGQVYHNQNQLNARGHVQITRSHVEVTTNGAKFGIGTQGIHTFLLGQMNEELAKGVIGKESPEGQTFDKVQEGYDLYFEKMVDRYKEYFTIHPRALAVNLFGGTGTKYKKLFEEIFGKELVILGDKIDVNDGSLLADPTRKEMIERVPNIKKVLAEGLRVHSFDLDADRGSVTEGKDALEVGKTGHYLGDDLAYILADYKLSIAVPKLFAALSNKTIAKDNLDKIHDIVTTVLVDPRYTSGVRSFVEAKGGKTVYHRKGHSLWKETMTANLEEIVKLAGCKSMDEFLLLTDGYQDIQIEASLHLFATDPEDGIPRDDAVENVFLLEMIFDALNIDTLKDYFSKIERRFATKEIRTNSTSNEAKEAITNEVIDKIKSTFKSDKFNIIEFDGQIRVDWDGGFIMYGMSNTSPKLTFMVEGSTIEDRNNALAYVLSLHNAIKKKYGDNLPMDLSENSFFVDDASYGMKNPDDIDDLDLRVKAFKNKMRIE